MGDEEESADVVCEATAGSHVLLVFSGTSDRSDGHMASLPFLAKWRISKIRWFN
jgi:hypothetical protein